MPLEDCDPTTDLVTRDDLVQTCQFLIVTPLTAPSTLQATEWQADCATIAATAQEDQMASAISSACLSSLSSDIQNTLAKFVDRNISAAQSHVPTLLDEDNDSARPQDSRVLQEQLSNQSSIYIDPEICGPS